MEYVSSALAIFACIAVYIWQDCANGWDNPCNDGQRYTSGKPQPTPFHRRFCGWNTIVLQITSLLSLVAIGALMGDCKRALLLGTLPGAWFISTAKTTVDAPSMLLALLASLVFPHNVWFAILLSCLSGFIHERGPVFAVLYTLCSSLSWSPLILLVGLVAVGWWREPAKPDNDLLVGRGIRHAIKAHKPYVDFLDWKLNFFALRGVPFIAAFLGAPPSAWLTLVIANASRIVGTDSARYLFWAAPALIRGLPDVPAWMVAAHVVTLRRMI